MKAILPLLLLILSKIVSSQVVDLNYTVDFTFIKCADVNIKVFDNKDNIKITATAKSSGLADFFVSIDEKYDCYIDTYNHYLPIKIEKVSKSGDSLARINLNFDHKNNIITNSILGDYKTLPNTYDFISGFLLIADSVFFKGNDEKQINIFFDNSPCILHAKYCGIKTIEKITCKKIELRITKLSKDNKSKKFISLIPPNSTHCIWVSNTYPSYLVSAKINLVAGSLKVELKR